MGGLTTVAVAPEHRGAGLGRRVCTAAIHAMCERGEVLSSLYPAATSLYRSLGWEVAGVFAWRSLAPRFLLALAKPAAGRARRLRDGDRDAVRACYARFAREVNGFVERSARRWESIEAEWQDREVYVAENAAGEIEGFLEYRQLDGEYSVLGGDFQLAVRDVVACTRDAALALWRLLGSWSTQVDRVIYRGPAEDPLLLLLPDQDVTTLAEIRWMSRVLDPAGAVRARGYAPAIDAEIHLRLEDAVLPGNSGPFVLSVRKGEGLLDAGGNGGIELDIGAFSSLYTGWATTAGLARAGRLRGGDAEMHAALDAVFAGPTPWMLDEF